VRIDRAAEILQSWQANSLPAQDAQV